MTAPPSGDRETKPGNVRPSSPGPLVLVGAVAAVLGWAVRPLCLHFDVNEPVISLWSVVVVWLLGIGVGSVAWRTWRVLQHGSGPRLESYQAVNRLVLGKAAALTGAVVLGGYAGFAIAHLGIAPTELSGQRLVRSLVSAAGGLLLVVAGLLLERACRVKPDPD